MSKPLVRLVVQDISNMSDYEMLLEVYVEDQYIGGGSYGGAPEDNTRGRDYSWVEPLLIKLSEQLGAIVRITEDTDE